MFFCLWHAKNFKHKIWHVSWAFNLKYFIFFAIEINLVGVFRFAELARADLVDGREAVLLVIVVATTGEPLPQALEVDVPA